MEQAESPGGQRSDSEPVAGPQQGACGCWSVLTQPQSWLLGLRVEACSHGGQRSDPEPVTGPREGVCVSE
jgi:hypothetical protein